jgi:hypothetical protein
MQRRLLTRHSAARGMSEMSEPTNLGWIPWHPKYGFSLEELVDREEDKHPMTAAPGWVWVEVYAHLPQTGG